MGSGQSSEKSSSRRTSELRDHEAELRRQKEKLEADQLAWQEKRLREHWEKQKLDEAKKLREAQLEWQRQQDLDRLRLQHLKMQKQLEEQEVKRKLEQERLKKTFEEQAAAQAMANEQLLLLQRVKLHRQQSMQICATAGSHVNAESARVGVGLERRAAATVETASTTKQNVKPKSYVERLNDANVKCKEWSIIDYVQEKTFMKKTVVEDIMKLFDDDSSIPFIARYRKHLTQTVDVEKLRKVRDSYEQAKLIKRRAVAIVREMEQKGQWTPELHAFVHEIKSLNELEHVYSIFKNKQSKTLKNLISLGLEILADACLDDKFVPPLVEFVQESVEGLKTEKQIRDGIVGLLADKIIKDRRTFATADKVRLQCPMEIETSLQNANKSMEDKAKYEPYYNFKCMANNVHFIQVFTINKGEELKILKVRVNVPSEFERQFKRQCLEQYKFTGVRSSLKKDLIVAAVDSVYSKWMRNLVVKKTRQDINEKAINTAMDSLARNVKQHLLVPPVGSAKILGISPGFEGGCKLAMISEEGKVLDTETIHPHDVSNPRAKMAAKLSVVEMICRHKCRFLALGNGTACAETELFLANVLKHKNIASLDAAYTIVDQTGLTNRRRSRNAAVGISHLQTDMAIAVSIARRLQNPMAELVEVDSELMTEEMCQPEFSNNQLATKINEIIVETVSYVGVDANTASVALLKRVAGLDETKANSIVEWRKNNGPSIDRIDLLKVKGISRKVFEQCAGFIRIIPETAVAISETVISPNAFNPFDQTWIHPESYAVAQSFLDKANCKINELGSDNFKRSVNAYVSSNGYAMLAKRCDVDRETIAMIVQSLTMDRDTDIRGKLDSAIFRKSLIRFKDLTVGTVLTGTVVGLIKCGAFVDVSAEIDGLIHNNFMNGLTVVINQKVEVRVSRVSKEENRLNLALVKCL